MFEVRRVVDPGREHHDGGIGHVGGRCLTQRAQQVRRVVADRADPVGGEQVGKDPRHGAAVLHHVGHPRRGPQVVLEHPEGALFVADQVDAGDVDPDAVGRHDARGLPVEVVAGGHQPARDHPVAQDLLVAVDVVEVGLQRGDALFDAAFQPGPFGGRDHPGHQVQRERALLAVQREGDALIGEGPVQRLGARRQFGGVRRRQFLVDPLVRSADRALGIEHLVERVGVGAAFGVAVEDGRGLLGGARTRLSFALAGHSANAHRSHAAPRGLFRQAGWAIGSADPARFGGCPAELVT